jgi:hypothetical protein
MPHLLNSQIWIYSPVQLSKMRRLYFSRCKYIPSICASGNSHKDCWNCLFNFILYKETISIIPVCCIWSKISHIHLDNQVHRLLSHIVRKGPGTNFSLVVAMTAHLIKISFALQFQRFHPWSLGCRFLGLCWGSTLWWKGMPEASCFSSWQPDSKERELVPI